MTSFSKKTFKECYVPYTGHKKTLRGLKIRYFVYCKEGVAKFEEVPKNAANQACLKRYNFLVSIQIQMLVKGIDWGNKKK